VLVEERPRRYDREECESGAAETDIQDLIDVLCDEADEECYGADERKESVGDVFGEALTFEVLCWKTAVSWRGIAIAGCGRRTTSPS
jgi:hypothetical protein